MQVSNMIYKTKKVKTTKYTHYAVKTADNTDTTNTERSRHRVKLQLVFTAGFIQNNL